MKDNSTAVDLRDHSLDADDFLADAIAGLSAQPKTLPCKYFYDAAGSALFERICELPEYYLTRSEVAIMERHAARMAEVIGPAALLVEYGSGSSLKTRYLLDHLRDPAGYVPIDISREHLVASAAAIGERYGHVEVLPVCADYTQDHPIPTGRAPVRTRVVYFPGSTIGNFEPGEAGEFLEHVGREVGHGGGLLVGVDLEKSARIIEPAYDDAAGVTDRFNRNILRRLRDELGAQVDVSAFIHRAVYNERQHRVEMRLVSMRDQAIMVGGRRFALARGESILTEYSHKYSLERFAALADRHGFTVRRVWTDDQGWFSVQYLTLR